MERALWAAFNARFRFVDERGGCPRWPATMWLRSSDGELVAGRCRSTNRCEYCARLGAVEEAELLALDAMLGEAPALWAVLTTRSTSTDPADFYRARENVQRAVRAWWPDAQFCWVIEFTTGYGRLSGGERRPHWNLLLKGVPADDVAYLRDVIVAVWCDELGGDALPAGQYAGRIAHEGGLMKYLALHFLKESQRPPAGWSGHRVTRSRGYLWAPTPEARKAARESLQRKRDLHRMIEQGMDAWTANDRLDALAAHRELTAWRMVKHAPTDPVPARTAPAPRPGATLVPVDALAARVEAGRVGWEAPGAFDERLTADGGARAPAAGPPIPRREVRDELRVAAARPVDERPRSALFRDRRASGPVLEPEWWHDELDEADVQRRVADERMSVSPGPPRSPRRTGLGPASAPRRGEAVGGA